MDQRQNKNTFGGNLSSAKQLVCYAVCCAEQSHKDNVRSSNVEEQLKQKVVRLSEPSSTSLLLMMVK